MLYDAHWNLYNGHCWCINLINGNYEKTNRYIHEKNRIEREGFSPWVDCWTHERICRPGAPRQRHTYHNHLQYHIVLQHTDYGSNVQREQAVTQQAQTLEEDYMSTLTWQMQEPQLKSTSYYVWKLFLSMQTFASPKFNLTASGYFHNLAYAQL